MQVPAAPSQPNRLSQFSDPLRIAWWGGSLYAILLIAAYSFRTALPGAEVLTEYVQYLPLTIAAAVVFGLASRRTALLPGTRSSLRWLAAGLAGSSLGIGYYIWMHVIQVAPRGLPRLGDAIFLLSYGAITIGLLRVPRRAPGQYEMWKVVLDAAVVAVGIGLIGWHLVIAPTTVAITGALELFVRIAYPLLDIAFLFALNGVLIGGGPAEHRRAFARVAAGIVFYLIAESIYQVLYYGPTVSSPALGIVSETCFTLAYLCLLFGALRYLGPREPKIPAQYIPVTAYSPLPLLTTAGVALMVTHAALDSEREIPATLALGLVMVSVLLLVRQGLTARQNTALLRQQAQRAGDTRVAALVKHASDLIIVTERDRRIRFVSPSSERILGISPGRMTGQEFGSLVHPEDHSLLLGERASAAGGPVATPLRLRHQDGTWVEFDVALTDLVDEPAVAGMIYVARDLTERNLFEARLRQAQKMEAVGRLAGGVAHDFNNLLTTILASTDLLLENRLEPELQSDLEIIRQAAGRAAGLTGQLLAFSRQERLQRRDLDLVVLVEETISLLRRLLGQEIMVQMNHQTETIPIKGDANQLAQVIVNLALNARDAMPKGGMLTIETGCRELTDALEALHGTIQPGSYAVIEVRDNGTGMDQETLARIFEPFFTTKAAGKGTGLGMSTTQRIVEQHGGGVEVTSIPGTGTTVRIMLPWDSMPESDNPEAVAAAARPDSSGTETILVVEDEASVRDVTARILRRFGYQVMVASEASQARRLLADSESPKPDLIVTDVMMPGMTGPELASKVVVDFPEMRILFMSGYPGDELGRLGLRADEVPFLQKPFTPTELAEQVRSLLDQVPAAGRWGTGAIDLDLRN
jgi:PAS domain S-box-containing protein